MRDVPSTLDRVRARLHRSFALVGGLWLVVAVVAVGILAWVWAGPDGWSRGSPGPLVLDGLLLLAGVGGAVAGRRFARRRLDEASVAREMDRAAGLSEGAVYGSLELARRTPDGVSSSLARHAGEGIAASLDTAGSDLTGGLGARSRRWGRRAWGALVTAAGVLLVLAVSAPDRWENAAAGLARPFDVLRAALPTLEIRPGDVEVLRGESLDIEIVAPGRDEVTLHWQSAGELVSQRTLVVTSGRGTSRLSVRAPTRYWATSPDGARTADFEIRPYDPLFVTDVSVSVTFPAHTGRSPEDYRGDVPPLRLPVGSSLRVEGNANRGLAAGALVAADAPRVEFEVTGSAFEARWSPSESGTYDWAFTDATGATAEVQPLPLEIELVPDAAPRIAFTFPAVDTVLPLSMRQPLVLEATDDYGLRSVELVAYRVDRSGGRGEPVAQRLPLGGTRGAVARPVIDVSSWGLLPGDEVRYFGRASDNAPRAGVAETREWTLRVPGAGEIRRQAQARLDDASARMEDLADRAREAAEETRELERVAASAENQVEGARRSADADFEQRESVRRALEDQEGLETDVDSLRADLAELERAMREAGLAEQDLRRDLEELQALLREIASEETRETLEAMTEGLDELDVSEARQTLEQLSEAQDAFRERIETSLERFGRAAVEQDFRATREEVEELARQEDALSEAMREGDDPGLRAEQQAGLEQRTEEMEARTERLEERLQELGELDAARGVRRSREASASARERMADASRAARAGQNRQAGDAAGDAAESLEASGRELAEAREQMAERRTEAVRAALERAAQDALLLARRQSELNEAMDEAAGGDVAGMRADVAAVLQGIQSMSETLGASQRASGGADPQVAGSLEEAMRALQGALDAMSQRPGSAPAPALEAREAVDALNAAALQAMAAAQAGSSQGSPGAQDVGEQLQSLAQQQGEVNNQAGQIMPLQLGAASLQSQLERLAEGQRSVAGELDRVNAEPGSEGALGDLEALADEARRIAEALAGGRLDPETRRRQERLFHRLLDAGRSLENDEELSDRRESEAASPFARGVISQLTTEDTGVVRFGLPDPEVLRRLGPAERQLVLRYFERLNREAGRPGGGSR